MAGCMRYCSFSIGTLLSPRDLTVRWKKPSWAIVSPSLLACENGCSWFWSPMATMASACMLSSKGSLYSGTVPASSMITIDLRDTMLADARPSMVDREAREPCMSATCASFISCCNACTSSCLSRSKRSESACSVR